MSACSSNDVPTTPLTSDDDDEWPGLNLTPGLPLRPAAHRADSPAMISNTVAPKASSSTALRFTLVDPEGGRTDEGEMSWYTRKLGQVVSLASPCTHALRLRRLQTLLFPPPSRASGKGPRSRMSKPLRAMPCMQVPNPQLDPTSRVVASHGTGRDMSASPPTVQLASQATSAPQRTTMRSR